MVAYPWNQEILSDFAVVRLHMPLEPGMVFRGESSGMRWAMRFGWWKSSNENGHKYQEGLKCGNSSQIFLFIGFCNLRQKSIMQLAKWFSREFPNSTWPFDLYQRDQMCHGHLSRNKYINWIYIVFPLANRSFFCQSDYSDFNYFTAKVWLVGDVFQHCLFLWSSVDLIHLYPQQLRIREPKNATTI